MTLEEATKLEEAMKRIEALEAKLEMTAPTPAVESHQIPEGWMLVNSEDIPWSDDNPTWEFCDPNDPEVGWACTTHLKPWWRACLIVARPIWDA